jgi:sugar phosphate isomerase/epimerase
VGTSVGLTRYEVRFLKTGRAPICDSEELLEVERCAHERNVELTALSPGLFKYVSERDAFERELNDVYPAAAEWAHRWKLPGLIVFGFHKPGATEETGDLMSSAPAPEFVIDWLRKSAERAEADGLVLMIEPEPVCWADSWATTLDMIRRAASSALKINYDPGNVAWMERADSLPDFYAAASLIANVHVKDVEAAPKGSGKPTFVPAGKGMIDYKAHFAALRRANYTGPISLEPHMDGSQATVQQCKSSFEAVWASAATYR